MDEKDAKSAAADVTRATRRSSLLQPPAAPPHPRQLDSAFSIWIPAMGVGGGLASSAGDGKHRSGRWVERRPTSSNWIVETMRNNGEGMSREGDWRQRRRTNEHARHMVLTTATLHYDVSQKGLEKDRHVYNSNSMWVYVRREIPHSLVYALAGKMQTLTCDSALAQRVTFGGN